MKLRSGRRTPVTKATLVRELNSLISRFETVAPFKMDDTFYEFCKELCKLTYKNRFYLHECNSSNKKLRNVLYTRTQYLIQKIQEDEYIYDLSNGGEEEIVELLLCIKDLSVDPYWTI